MSQAEKDVKKKQTVKSGQSEKTNKTTKLTTSTKSASTKSTTTKSKTANVKTSGTKSGSTKATRSEKLVEEANKSLTPEKTTSKKPQKGKVSDSKGLTEYEEQALQGATKSKGNKKLLIILLLIGGVVAIAVAIALLFVLKPEEDVKAVVCEVEVLSYCVDMSTDPEEYLLVGSGDKFNFTTETQKTSSFTKDVDITITDSMDFAMTYLVNNVTPNSYSYTLDFSNLEVSNCNVVVKVNNDKAYTIDSSRKVITISQLGDVVLEVRISGINPPVYDENDQEGWLEDMQNWATNTWCDGDINLTLEVN